MSTVSEPDRVNKAESSQEESTAEVVANQNQSKLGELAAQHTPMPRLYDVLSLPSLSIFCFKNSNLFTKSLVMQGYD